MFYQRPEPVCSLCSPSLGYRFLVVADSMTTVNSYCALSTQVVRRLVARQAQHEFLYLSSASGRGTPNTSVDHGVASVWSINSDVDFCSTIVVPARQKFNDGTHLKWKRSIDK